MKRSPLTSSIALIISLAMVHSTSLAGYNDFYRNYQDQQQDFQKLQETDKFQKDKTSTLNGPQIKEFSEKIKSFKKLIFKDGGSVLKNAFRLDSTDAGTGNSVVSATGGLGEFSSETKKKIL